MGGSLRPEQSDTGGQCVWPVEGDTAQEMVYGCSQDRLDVNPSLATDIYVTEETS